MSKINCDELLEYDLTPEEESEVIRFSIIKKFFEDDNKDAQGD